MDCTLSLWCSGNTLKVVEESGTVWQWEEKRSEMRHFFLKIGTLFFLFLRHGLGQIDDLVVAGRLGWNDESLFSREVVSVFGANGRVDGPLLVLSVLNGYVLGVGFAYHRIELKLLG